jgi:hypothetical protein
MGNVARGQGRRHQAIEDDGTRQRNPGDKILDMIVGLVRWI